jgi:membrane protease subunit HflK
MAWNEPGNDNNRDPWNNKGNNDQGPPDIDEVVRKLQDKMGRLFGGDGGKKGDGSPPDDGDGFNWILVLIIVAVAGLLFLAYQSFYTIQPAERGVVKRFGAYHTITAPGPHLKLPFIDVVETVNVDQVNKFQHRAQMLTKDENIVDISVEVQFRVQDAADFLFQDANPGKTIRGSMESTLREVIGKNNLDEIITANRAGIALAVKLGTQDLLNLYRTGLQVTEINIQNAQPPEAVQDAFADAIKAREDKERLQNQAQAYANDAVPRARGNAARQIEDAKAYRARVTAEAEGESKRFLALLREYEKAPQVTRERLYLETMQNVLQNSTKVLLDTKEGSNNLTYLPLDRLMRQSNASFTQDSAAQSSPFTPNDALASSIGTGGDRNARNRLSRERGPRQ